jgi:hypothetical protein
MLEACHLYCDHGYVKICLKSSRVWGSNPQDFTKQAQSRKVVQLEKIKIVINHFKWTAQGKGMIVLGFLSYRSHGVSCETGL